MSVTNSLSTYTARHKYFSTNIQLNLRQALVSEDICVKDTSNTKTIENPYITNVAAAIQAVAGTYTPALRTTTDDAVTVADEVIVSAHVYDFEMKTMAFDLVANFLDDLMYQVAFKMDQFVLNKVLDVATGTYTTPVGGFTTPANIPQIVGDLWGKVAGFQTGIASNPFLIVESTDLTGFAQISVASGWNYADLALNNGFAGNYMGVKVYVVRTGTFVTTTLGTLTAVNSGHRLFGISKLAVMANPGGINYEEKAIGSETGKEIVAYGYVGANVWNKQLGLFVDITLA